MRERREEERFGSREQRDGECAKSLPRTGKRYKSVILQLKRLTFMVTGQLHLVGSLINIDRLGNNSLLFSFCFSGSGTCYANPLPSPSRTLGPCPPIER